MERDLCGLNLYDLNTMYEREAERLNTALLNGALWEELKDQRKNVTELAIAIHKKTQVINSNPAESVYRKESDAPESFGK